MSDAPHFDPSMLEGKGKDELTTIATSLGKKPPARAKKADVIALIMELVGAPATAAEPLEGADDPAGTKAGVRIGDEPAVPDGPAAEGSDAGGATGRDGTDSPVGSVGDRSIEPSAAQPSSRGPGAGRSSSPLIEETSETGRSGEGPRSDMVGDRAARPNATTGDRSGFGQEASRAQRNSDQRGRTDREVGRISRPGTGTASGADDTLASASGNSTEGGRGEGLDAGPAQGGGANQHVGRTSGGTGNGNDRDAGRVQGPNANPNPNPDLERSDNPNQVDPTTRPDSTSGDSGDGEVGDDGESANRRRRRRGRDRERRPDGEGGEQGQGQPEPLAVEGLVELRDEGYGFLRLKGYLPTRDDAYISVKQTRQFGLRTGDVVAGKARPANRNEKNPALLQVERVNGHPSHQQPPRRRFDDLTPLFPDERLRLELADDPTNATVRIVDLVAPIGKGQRGLIVSPPKAGKTTIVKHLVRSIEVNHPEVELLVLLVDERPEEVTDMRRWLVRGTVAASTFDRPAEEHITVSELVIERAKRLVEDGKDVVVILDGITRLARAYNLAAPATGRVMAGGIDTGALYPPKKFFGAARNAEEGGSLTIVATALVETNTRMDEVIFEEFKGTGNMELKLDRKLAERRIFPAIDVDASSTRHEELLFTRQQLPQVWKLRRVLGALRDDSGSSAAGIEMLTDRLKAFKTNDAFLAEVARTTSS